MASDGETADISGQSKFSEAVNIEMDNDAVQSEGLGAVKVRLGDGVLQSGSSGSVQYRTYVQGAGWQDWVKNGATSGSSDQSKCLEAIEVKLTDDLANAYDVRYRTRAKGADWQDWVKNGETSGTTGKSKHLDALEIQLVKKEVAEDSPAPSDPISQLIAWFKQTFAL